MTEVNEDYEKAFYKDTDQEYIECGGVPGKEKNSGGCGELIALDDFLKIFMSVPNAGLHTLWGLKAGLTALLIQTPFMNCTGILL